MYFMIELRMPGLPGFITNSRLARVDFLGLRGNLPAVPPEENTTPDAVAAPEIRQPLTTPDEILEHLYDALKSDEIPEDRRDEFENVITIISDILSPAAQIQELLNLRRELIELEEARDQLNDDSISDNQRRLLQQRVATILNGRDYRAIQDLIAQNQTNPIGIEDVRRIMEKDTSEAALRNFLAQRNQFRQLLFEDLGIITDQEFAILERELEESQDNNADRITQAIQEFSNLDVTAARNSAEKQSQMWIEYLNDDGIIDLVGVASKPENKIKEALEYFDDETHRIHTALIGALNTFLGIQLDNLPAGDPQRENLEAFINHLANNQDMLLTLLQGGATIDNATLSAIGNMETNAASDDEFDNLQGAQQRIASWIPEALNNPGSFDDHIFATAVLVHNESINALEPLEERITTPVAAADTEPPIAVESDLNKMSADQRVERFVDMVDNVHGYELLARLQDRAKLDIKQARRVREQLRTNPAAQQIADLIRNLGTRDRDFLLTELKRLLNEIIKPINRVDASPQERNASKEARDLIVTTIIDLYSDKEYRRELSAKEKIIETGILQPGGPTKMVRKLLKKARERKQNTGDKEENTAEGDDE